MQCNCPMCLEARAEPGSVKTQRIEDMLAQILKRLDEPKAQSYTHNLSAVLLDPAGQAHQVLIPISLPFADGHMVISSMHISLR